MDLVYQIEESDEEDAASVKVRKKSRKPKKQDALSKQHVFIPLQVLNSREEKGKPLDKRYGFIRASKGSLHKNLPELVKYQQIHKIMANIAKTGYKYWGTPQFSSQNKFVFT